MATASPKAEPSGALHPHPLTIDAGALDAPSSSGRPRLGRLWQLPLLIGSLGLFGYAGYRFIDPKPGPTLDDRLAVADQLLASDRGEAAAEQLRALLAEDDKKVSPESKARAHLAMAQAIEQVQRERRLDVPANHLRIIEQSKLAEKAGGTLTAADHRRVAASYEALGKPGEALGAYRRAMAADPAKASGLHRKVIDILIAGKDADGASAELKKYLAAGGLSPGERAWALGEQSRLLVDRNLFGDAKTLLDEALANEPDPLLLGQLNYRLGYCHWKLGEPAEAERYLRLARDLLKINHPEDADAALLLGQLLQAKGKHDEAISFFQSVIVGHPDAAAAPPARLGRGVSRIEAGADDAGLTDLQDVTTEIANRPARQRYRADALAAVRRAGDVLTARGNLGGALELLAAEQTLEPTPSAGFFARLSGVYERRSIELGTAADAMPDGPDKIRKQQQARDLLAKAGDAAVAQSRGLTVDDDRGYGQALWRGIDLYDRAGVLPQAIGALELFVAERPDDPLTPDAILRLGKAFHAAGRFDKAVAAFQQNQFRYPQSLAASKSGVPLARSYRAKGVEFYPKAEAALRATLDSPLLTPDAEEFRLALFDLAELHYRTGRYVEAVQRLEELEARYPQDERTGQLLFLMADSYRKSAGELAPPVGKTSATPAAVVGVAAVSSATPTPADPATPTVAQEAANRAERIAARRDRLAKSRQLYDRVVERYRDAPPKSDLDEVYQKLAHFYRADCAYDLAAYEEAIRLYDAAALRYQDDAGSLAAYVQIVNAYAALGRPDEAKAANERARTLLRRMPAAAFKEAQRTMPQKSWDDWVSWSKTAGLWSAGER
jgi:tetratricopeptide (TPR) repeat protein